MAKTDIDTVCSCGARFKAFGDSIAVGFRYREWLDIHEKCIRNEGKEKEEK